ncbi:type II secretion system protein GspL, partial [Staphylococcus aureus]
VAVVARNRLDQWLEQFASAGLQPHALVPDVLSLPKPTDDAWPALADGEQLLVRTSEFNGFSSGGDEMELMLQIADAGAET